jgi:hypothetical protein
MDFGVAGLYAIAIYPDNGYTSEYSPFGEYSIAFVSEEGQKVIYVFSGGGRVVQIDFWELTPPEMFFGFDGEYVLPPL